ncbi:hypothetical protein J1N35_026256 [Gossypium stocksii]|uniref:Uncharacterized protein n=1 Tax=Gossypium stocksii TaxID=47602 RepID=A0A9D3V996_9ROSI|nr:hypothetical protein J1N35_026256 [Gossypium stocksii]
MDDLLRTTSTSEGTSNMPNVSRSENKDNNESNVNPPREPSAGGSKVGLFSELEPVSTELEDNKEGDGDDEEEDLQFTVYFPVAHMHNFDVSTEDTLEFVDLPHKRLGHINAFSDSGDLEVGRELFSKDDFLTPLKRYSIKNGVNFYVVKFKSEKFERTFSQDHLKLDSDMIIDLILLMVKEDLKTNVSVLIANIHSQFNYTPLYCKAWITKQKVLKKMHSRWDASYNVGTRHLPITTVVEETYFCLVEVFPKQVARYAGKLQGGHILCPVVMEEINNGCVNLCLDPIGFVNEVYKLEKLYNVWRHVFPSVPDERKWLFVSFAPFKLLPDRDLRRKPKGQLCSTQIRDNMDIWEHSNQQRLCGWCRNPVTRWISSRFSFRLGLWLSGFAFSRMRDGP